MFVHVYIIYNKRHNLEDVGRVILRGLLLTSCKCQLGSPHLIHNLVWCSHSKEPHKSSQLQYLKGHGTFSMRCQFVFQLKFTEFQYEASAIAVPKWCACCASWLLPFACCPSKLQHVNIVPPTRTGLELTTGMIISVVKGGIGFVIPPLIALRKRICTPTAIPPVEKVSGWGSASLTWHSPCLNAPHHFECS